MYELPTPEGELEKKKLGSLAELWGVGFFAFDLQSHMMVLNELFTSSINDLEFPLPNPIPMPLVFDDRLETFLSWLKPEDRAAFDMAMDLHVKEGVPFSMDLRFITPTKAEKKYEARAQVIRSDEGDPVYMVGVLIGNGLGQNTTEADLKSLIADHQNFVVKNARETLLGKMVGDVAFELSFPLGNMVGQIQQINKWITEGGDHMKEMGEATKKILQSVSRVNKTVNRLKAFASDTEDEAYAPIPVTHLIDDAFCFCRHTLQALHIAVTVAPVPPEITIECRRTEIAQAILNIVTYAKEAVADAEEKSINLEVQQFGTWVSIIISNSAEGGKKVYEAVSAVQLGKDTALRLEIAQEIIEKHNGTLEYDETIPISEFTISIPATRDS